MTEATYCRNCHREIALTGWGRWIHLHSGQSECHRPTVAIP